ncbi:hypothetical protein J2T12_004898 [Paenibacillus anaericanus]|uniref:hypothetical protein n=1 Tax=Paenibacillus anaericanus TaxID=170367 RepID=UPI0027857701|nr:hypothetical protein [Paenibacillus anaericanus]MDQ0091461.1 hypothetical protein [Paenibacillus anaericanus]
MMKLLKYDLKRNASTFLSVGAILIALQLIISIMGNIRGWDPKIILTLTIVLYSFVGTFSVILVAITYRKNIKAYSRRLLPQRSSNIIFSVLVLGWITFIVLLAISVLHIVIYNYFERILSADQIADLLGSVPDVLVVLFQLFWAYTFLFVTIMLASTISASIKGRLGGWIGIISFFAIQSALNWLEVKLLGETNGASGLVISRGTEVELTNMTGGGQLTIDRSLLLIDWRTVTIELIFIALIIYATALLLNRKEQV